MLLREGNYEPGANRAVREALIRAIHSPGSDAAEIISKSTGDTGSFVGRAEGKRDWR